MTKARCRSLEGKTGREWHQRISPTNCDCDLGFTREEQSGAGRAGRAAGGKVIFSPKPRVELSSTQFLRIPVYRETDEHKWCADVCVEGKSVCSQTDLVAG